ncbi:MAG: transaldolase [Nibricoccus sp.]
MRSLSDLKIKLYADGADTAGILALYAKPYIHGLTTNPTLMRKAGVANYEAFAKDILQTVTAKPISFEVISDDFGAMEKEALKIASWGKNVFVKIPITNSHGASSVPLIKRLVEQKVQLNLTALLSLEQVEAVAAVLSPTLPTIVSIFAGRIADTGRDPIPIVKEARKRLSHLPRTELLWASVREVLNLVHAEQSGCDIVTVTHDILARASQTLGMDLDVMSRETVQMFARDAAAARYSL